MIEAVNSALASASLAREVSAQSQKPVEVTKAAVETVQAPYYISPFISLDGASNGKVIQIRDSLTGDILAEYPSETLVRSIQTEQNLLQELRFDQQKPVEAASQNTLPTGFGQVGVTFDSLALDAIQSESQVSSLKLPSPQATAVLSSASSVSTTSVPSSGGEIANATVNVTA